MKIAASGPGCWAFHCPGCNLPHGFYVAPAKSFDGRQWTWNGDAESPTVSPSISVFEDQPAKLCRGTIGEGSIAFSADSHHALKGQTVALPEWPAK